MSIRAAVVVMVIRSAVLQSSGFFAFYRWSSSAPSPVRSGRQTGEIVWGRYDLALGSSLLFPALVTRLHARTAPHTGTKVDGDAEGRTGSGRMEKILKQQEDLLKFGEELLKESSKKMREAAGPDAWRQAYEMWMGFYQAVDWTERWIQCLLGFHVVVLAIALITRKSETAQMVIFALCMCLAFGAERINTLARDNWKAFSTQDYFDERGLFISVMLSGPLLCILIVVLVNFLFLMTGVMVKVKRAELKRKYGKGGNDDDKKKGAVAPAGGAVAAGAAADTKKDK